MSIELPKLKKVSKNKVKTPKILLLSDDCLLNIIKFIGQINYNLSQIPYLNTKESPA